MIESIALFIPRVVVYLLAALLRLALILVGIILVPFLLLGDGETSTPRLFRWFGNTESIPDFWYGYPIADWRWAHPIVMFASAWYFTQNMVHPLLAIYFYFGALGSLIVFDKFRWHLFHWMAIRNPLEGLDAILEQPEPEIKPNPDDVVRSGAEKSDHRWMEAGIFWEYWYLRKLKSGKYFEVRVGWKFVDGNLDFVPTFQIGPKK